MKSLYMMVTADDMEEPLYVGTVEEVADYLHKPVQAIYEKACRDKKKLDDKSIHFNGYRIVVVKVSDREYDRMMNGKN